MKVETYEITEQLCDVDQAEEVEKARELIEELELEGQKQFISPDGVTIPFRQMTTEETNVYSVLLKSRCDVNKFSYSLIPARVLGIIKMFRNSFDKGMEVRYSEADKDPILVGKMQNKERSYQNDDFILARWGEELEPMSVLREKAMKVYRAKTKAELESIRMRVITAINTIDSASPDILITETPKTPSFYF